MWFNHPLSGLSENQPQHRVLSQKQHRLHRNQGWAYPDQRGAGVPRNCDHPGRAPFLGIVSGAWKEGGIQILFLFGSKEAVNNFRLLRSWMFPLSLPKACLAQCHAPWSCLNQPGHSTAGAPQAGKERCQHLLHLPQAASEPVLCPVLGAEHRAGAWFSSSTPRAGNLQSSCSPVTRLSSHSEWLW